jgi:hypothetical protein
VNAPGSVEGICEVSVHRPAAAPRGWLLIEVPHGATRKSDYETLAARLKSKLPADLDHFFFVNTDIGAPEGAECIGRTLSAQGFGVVVARCLIPRTLIDTNRVIADSQGGKIINGLTPAVPGYIDDPADASMLIEMHAAYHALVAQAYDSVCVEEKGLALQLHSFSPRSVQIEKTDAGIVDALHAAYVPEVYAKWPERPAVDLISATEDGSFQTAPKLVAALRAEYAAAGIDAKENATYHLHPVTMGLFYARAHPDRVLCVELNRGLVADPFVPFGVSPISAAKVERMVAPIARVLAAALGS